MNRTALVLSLAAIMALSGCVTKYVTVSAVPRSDLLLVVFTDDEERGDELLEWLEERGYDNEQNHVARPEDDESAIYWGAAPLSFVEEIAAYVEGRYELELDREHEFDADDYSVYIHLGTTGTARSSTPDREDLRVVVFTDQEARGDSLLERLRTLGFTNDENYVTDEPNDEFNIKYGAAPEELVDEIAAAVDSLFDREVDEQRSFSEDDRDVFVNLPFSPASAELSRSDFEITVFCDDEAAGRRLLEKLAELGYTHDENEVLAGPNDQFNVKYGALPEPMLDEIAGLVQREFEVEPERLAEFGSSSTQVFINIPAKE